MVCVLYVLCGIGVILKSGLKYYQNQCPCLNSLSLKGLCETLNKNAQFQCSLWTMCPEHSKNFYRTCVWWLDSPRVQRIRWSVLHLTLCCSFNGVLWLHFRNKVNRDHKMWMVFMWVCKSSIVMHFEFWECESVSTTQIVKILRDTYYNWNTYFLCHQTDLLLLLVSAWTVLP